MARVAQNGLTLSLDEAKAGLLDNKGNLLEFEEQDNGTFKSKAVESDGYAFTCELNPQPVIVSVSVSKGPKGQETKNASKEEQKAIEDAKTVAANAPDAKTKKEAEKVASIGGKRY